MFAGRVPLEGAAASRGAARGARRRAGQAAHSHAGEAVVFATAAPQQREGERGAVSSGDGGAAPAAPAGVVRACAAGAPLTPRPRLLPFPARDSHPSACTT